MQKQYAYFSAAIRDGAKLRPQANRDGLKSRSCALEAGVEALTGRCEMNYEILRGLYPYMFSSSNSCPVDECAGIFFEPNDSELVSLCWHLNDTHKWTREKIADWLYAEEEKLGFVTLVETEASPELSLKITTVERHGAVASIHIKD